MYNEGISVAGDLVDLGVEHGVVKKNGNSYSFKEVKLGVGREAAKKTVKHDKKLLGEIRKAIVEKIKTEEAEEEKKNK
jgi:recombination protein RecA